MMTERITPRFGCGTPRKKDTMKSHTFSDATKFFDNVGTIDIILGGVCRRPRSGIGGNVAIASVGTTTMTIALLLSSAACGGHAFTLAGHPATLLHGRHQLKIPPWGGQRRRSSNDSNLYAGIISKGGHQQWQRQPAALAAAALVAAALAAAAFGSGFGSSGLGGGAGCGLGGIC